MAITDTKQAKDFTAGAPKITLKGDLTPMKMASEPDIMDERNELSLRLFGKELKLLTPEEMDILDQEAERLMQKFMADGGRAQYGLGSLVKSVKKGVKGVVKGAKDFAKSDVGKALIATYFLGGGNLGGMLGSRPGFQFSNLPGASLFQGDGILSKALKLKDGADFMNTLKVAGAGSVITGLLASKERQAGESDMDFAQRQAQVKDQLNVQFRRLYPQGGNESDEDYDVRISALVEGADDQTVPVGEMADGGRVMRAMGDSASDNAVQAAGIEGLPLRENSKGVKEIDLRKTGGFIPPVGVKEKADDIPAMLSNNEFVFTADAVRAAGGGSVNKGAQRMYDLMKGLESKVV